MIVTSLTGSSSPSTVIAGASDWRTAVTDLIAWMVANGRCFSSGEIAAYLRTYRSDLAFRVASVGEFLRDAYDNGCFPNYDDGAGNSIYPTQVPRTTTGIARTLDGRTVQTKTPVGLTVFVYAKDGGDGFSHDFEIFVPDFDDPQATRATLYTGQAPAAPTVTVTPSVTPGAAPVVSAPPTAKVGVLITGALQKADVIAYVTADRRLCVPRAAFEAFVALTGIPLRGGPNGDPVYVEKVGAEILVTRNPSASGNSVAYHLWVTRGRIAFDAATVGVASPFTPGDKYEVTVRADALVVNLARKV